MTGSRTALLAVLILAALIGFSWWSQSTSDQASQDADLVYCMTPAHQAALVDAAVNMKLVRRGPGPMMVKFGGTTMSVGEWQAKDPAAFKRTCDAYAGQGLAASSSSGGSSAQGGGLGALLLVLLPTAVGAVLGLEFDEIARGAERRWAQADALRGSWSAFHRVLATYAREIREVQSSLLPTESEINPLRDDLVARLREMQARYRASPTLKDLRARLEGAHLGPDVAQGWEPGASEEAFAARRVRADKIDEALERYDGCLLETASKLEHRIWLPSRL